VSIPDACELYSGTEDGRRMLYLDFAARRIAKRPHGGAYWTMLDRRYRIIGGLLGDRRLQVRPVSGGWTATVERIAPKFAHGVKKPVKPTLD
jgi:hypothetical protein